MADLKAKLRNTGTLMAKQTVAGGGKGGATDWAHLKDKPFETLGDDFTVDNGELQIAEGSTLEIDNKSIVLDSDGKVSEAVPIYFETVNSGEFWCLDGWEREGNRSNLYRSVLPEEQRLLSNTDITDSRAFYCIVEYEDKTQDALEAGFVKEFDNQYAMRLPREITLYYFPNINNFTLWNGYASNYASVSKIYFTVPLTDGYDVPKEQLNRIVNYHQVGGKYIPIDNWSIVIGSEGRLKTRMNQEDYYTKAEIEAFPDNKSIIINSEGKIQEAVPVYTSTEEVITDINRGVALNRGLRYKPEWYYSPIDLPKELDFTNLGLNLYYNDFYSKINNFDITSPQTFTDAEGHTWTTTSNLEYEDEKYANYYLKLKLVDGVEGETGNVRISIDGSETPQYYLYQEYSLLDNWSGYNINLLLQDAETYPIIPRIYFSYYCGGSYNLYLVEASVDNMDVSQPVVITDNNGVNWTLTVTPNADPGKGPYITFVPDNLPSDFQYFNSVWDEEAQETWDLWFNYTGKSTVTKINQLPAEYVPIDNNTITVVDGKLVAQGGGSARGVTSVVYNTFVSDNQVGSLDVYYSNGDTSSYGVYAPSGGSSEWSNVSNKPFETVGEGLEVSGGAIKERVPVYTEVIDEMPAGLQITGWQDVDGIGDDADVQININGTDITLNTDTNAYTVSAKINNHIYSGSWTASTDLGHAYGGYTWTIPELSANPTCEFYLENIGSGDYNAHIYLNGVNCSNVEWLIITPNNAGDVIENYRDEGIFNMNCSWSYGQQSSTTVHQLPAQYVPIDNDTIINDNGVLKAAGGGSEVSVTQTLTSGTAIADVTVDGVTTTLYAPAGGSTQADWAETDTTADSYIQNKPAIFAKTNNAVAIGSTIITAATNSLVIGDRNTNWNNSVLEADNYSLAVGYAQSASSVAEEVIRATNGALVVRGKDTVTYSKGLKLNASNGSIAISNGNLKGEITASDGSFAMGLAANSSYRSTKTEIIARNNSFAGGQAPNDSNRQGIYAGYNPESGTTRGAAIAFGVNVRAYDKGSASFGQYTEAQSPSQTAVGKYNIADANSIYNFIVGNGTAHASRSNSFAAGADGNVYVKGDIYANVSDFTNPTNNGVKLANIPACPTTTAGTFTLQAVVDSDGNITYSWV